MGDKNLFRVQKGEINTNQEKYNENHEMWNNLTSQRLTFHRFSKTRTIK